MIYYVQKDGLAHYVRSEEEAKRLAADGYTVMKMHEMRITEEGDFVEAPENDGSASGEATATGAGSVLS